MTSPELKNLVRAGTLDVDQRLLRELREATAVVLDALRAALQPG